MSFAKSTINLIPHRGKMFFTEEINEYGKLKALGQGVVKDDALFLLDDGTLSESALLEYINQLLAAAAGYGASLEGKDPRRGFFVGTKDAEFLGIAKMRDTLTIKTEIREKISNVVFAEGEVFIGDDLIARSVNKIYETENESKLKPEDASLPNDAVKEAEETTQMRAFSDLRRAFLNYVFDVKEDDDSISFSFVLPKDFPAFDGHFPDFPLLPGIAHIEAAIAAMELHTLSLVRLKSIDKSKFAGVILPNMHVTLSVKMKDELRFNASLSALDKTPLSRFSGKIDRGV